jgi:hypothetical protein
LPTELHVDDDHESGGEQIKVLIADDHPMVIAGIRRTIESFEDIEIVGEAQERGGR